MAIPSAAGASLRHARRASAARACSGVAALVVAVVLPVLVYRLTGSLAWTSALVVATALPHLLVPLAAPGRPGPARADLASAALLGTLPLASATAGLSAWHVLAVAAGVHALAARSGAPGAEPGAGALAALLVPPLAALALAVMSANPLLLGAAALLGLAALLTTTTPPRVIAVAVPERAARAHGAARTAITGPSGRARTAVTAAAAAHGVAAGAWAALLLPWADRVLGVAPLGDARIAVLVTAWGLGALVGHLLAPAAVAWRGPERAARDAALAGLACAVAALGLTWWLGIVVVGTLWGAVAAIAASAAVDRPPAGQREPGQREPGQREPGQREPGHREPGQPDGDRAGQRDAEQRRGAHRLVAGLAPAAGAVAAGTVAGLTGPRWGLLVAVAVLAAAAALTRATPAPPAPRRGAAVPVGGPSPGRAAPRPG